MTNEEHNLRLNLAQLKTENEELKNKLTKATNTIKVLSGRLNIAHGVMQAARKLCEEGEAKRARERLCEVWESRINPLPHCGRFKVWVGDKHPKAPND